MKRIRTNRIISYEIIKHELEELNNKYNKFIYKNINDLRFYKDKNNGEIIINKDNIPLNFISQKEDKTYLNSICKFEYIDNGITIEFENSYDFNIDNSIIEGLLSESFIGIDEKIYE